MSYDLGFWWEDQPISTVEAGRKYGAMIEGNAGIADEHPALEIFYVELRDHFPFCAVEDFEVSPWATPPYRTSECVIISLSYPHRSEISELLLGLGSKSGLTCYDPQAGRVYFPRGEGSVRLELADGTVIDNPSQYDVTRELRGLSSDDWYVILETRPGWFIQVGFGIAAGVPAGTYALEFREGSEDRHFGVTLAEFPRIIDIFQRFLSGDSSWKDGFDFSPVSY